jgi:predicted phosphate transport protein (TIGR00153 family)
MPVRIIPRDEGFFDYFAQLARHIGESATLLHELFGQLDQAPAIAARIKKVETDGDQVAHTINQRIDTSFVTPLDREDIHTLAKRLDNVIDIINGVARRTVMFNVQRVRPGADRMADVLVRASRVISAAVGDMKKRARMVEHGRAIKVLEEEGDALYAESVSALFRSGADALEVLAWKDIFDALEEAIDQCEDVGNVLESIALKNS